MNKIEKELLENFREQTTPPYTSYKGSVYDSKGYYLSDSAEVFAYLLNEEFKVIKYCDKCNAPRSTDVCFKCRTETRIPAKGWSYPELPNVEPLVKLAREVGYNLIVHGSLERDIDLIAIPWEEDVIGELALLQLFIERFNLHQIGEIEYKPHKRIATSLQFDSYTKTIDLSIMVPERI